MADVYVNSLTQISTEPETTDSLVAVNRNTNEGKIIDYNLLADAILNKITSKQFSGLTTTSKLLTGAINELDSDVGSLNSSLASKVTYYILNGSNLDNGPTSSQYSVGLGVVDGQYAYIKFNVSWISFMIRIKPAVTEYRTKYGNANWTEWYQL